MPGKRLMSTFAIVACGVLLTGAGAATATNAPPVRAGAGVPAVGGTITARARGGHVFFTAYASDDLPGATVVLTGAIGDFGAGASVLRNGTVDPEHTSEFNLALTQGSFRIVIGALHIKFLNALSHAPFSLRTCSGHVSVTAAAPVVAGSGTGAYKGIRGSFKLTIIGNEVAGHPGQPCHRWSGLPLGEAIFLAGSGTVSFG